MSTIEIPHIYKDVTDFTHFNIPPMNCLKIFHLNIRSLNRNHNALIALLASLGLQFDIIVLSELWVYNLELFENMLPSYSFHFQIDDANQSSGICV
jgi:hypothetical protein